MIKWLITSITNSFISLILYRKGRRKKVIIRRFQNSFWRLFLRPETDELQHHQIDHPLWIGEIEHWQCDGLSLGCLHCPFRWCLLLSFRRPFQLCSYQHFGRFSGEWTTDCYLWRIRSRQQYAPSCDFAVENGRQSRRVLESGIHFRIGWSASNSLFRIFVAKRCYWCQYDFDYWKQQLIL